MLDYKRDRYRPRYKNRKECSANKANTGPRRAIQSRATYRPENNNAIVPIIDIEEFDPARPPRDSTWVRGVTSISGIQVDADPSAIAKGDLIKCLLLRDSVVATHLFSAASGSSCRYTLVAECGIKKCANDRFERATREPHFHEDILISGVIRFGFQRRESSRE